jgi:hypothetical protein
MEETLLVYGPAILVAALALILRHRQTKKKAKLRELHISVKSEGKKTPGREILEPFWEEDR